MMVGTNELRLNEATMIHLVEERLNARVLDIGDRVKVEGVSYIQTSNVFIVRVVPENPPS